MDWCQVRPHKNWGWFVLCPIEMKTKEYTYYQIIKKSWMSLAQACWPTFSFKIIIEIRFLVLKTLEHKVILGALLAVMDQKTQWNHQSTLGTPLPGDNILKNTERIGLARNVHELPVDAFVYENCSINVDTLTEFCTGFEVFLTFTLLP